VLEKEMAEHEWGYVSNKVLKRYQEGLFSALRAEDTW